MSSFVSSRLKWESALPTMSKQTSIELPNTHAENPVGQSVAVKRKRGRPAKQTSVKLDETVETASTSADHCCGKSSAAKRGRRTKPVFTATINAKAVTLEELQKGTRWLVYHKTGSDDRRSVLGSLFLSPLCRMPNESSPECRREIWLR